MASHRKHRSLFRPGTALKIGLTTAGVVFAVCMLLAGVFSAASFARPDHPAAPPTEAKFPFSSVLAPTRNLVPHPRVHLLAENFSGAQVIQVHRGDTLSSVAGRVLGSPKRWPILWWDNQTKVPNPNALRAGIRLHFGTWRHVRPWLSKRALAAIPKPVVTTAAVSQPSPAAASSAPVASASYSGAPGSFQACVIARESGGNPSAYNPASGAGGLYQFLPSTWAALGFASAYPGGAQTASVSVQNAAFEKAYAESGTSPWAPYDGC